MHSILLGQLPKLWQDFVDIHRVHSVQTAIEVNAKCAVFPFAKNQSSFKDLATFLPGF